MKKVALLITATVILAGCLHARNNDFSISNYSEVTFYRSNHLISWHNRRYPYVDCSSQDFSCLRSDLIDIVLPKSCSEEVLHRGWTYSNIIMEMVAETRSNSDPHVGAGFSVYYYRPSTKPNVLISVLYRPPTHDSSGHGYVQQIGWIDRGSIALPEQIAGHPAAWHPLSGRPIFEC
jgi:hypothetical protein